VTGKRVGLHQVGLAVVGRAVARGLFVEAGLLGAVLVDDHCCEPSSICALDIGLDFDAYGSMVAM
jgi:hypothetical protein